MKQCRTPPPGVRADHHDSSAAALRQRRRRSLAAEKRSFEVDIERPIPVLLGYVSEALDMDDAGAGDERVERTELVARPPNRFADLAGRADVGRRGNRSVAQLVRCLIKLLA